MTVSVVIGYKDFGDPHRRASFDYVTGWYSALGCEIVVDEGPRPYSRAASINAAVRRGAGDVIVQSDPDSLVDLARLGEAIDMATAADGLVVPHDRYLYVSPGPTVEVIDNGRDPATLTPDDCDDAGGPGLGNVLVFSRSTWEAAHGFDERFGMWGGDDAAFAYACAAFCGPQRRLPGDVVHLWHPRLPQSKPGHPGYIDQMVILGQYRDAAAIGPEAVRELVASR